MTGIKSTCFIVVLAMILLTGAICTRATQLSLNLFPELEHSPFELGVASAEPTPGSVLIWTRAQRTDASLAFAEDQNITWVLWKVSDVGWQVNGTAQALQVNDFTLTVDVDGLDADTLYYYQFIHTTSGNSSEIGRTRTAPALASEQTIKIAAVSCSSIWSGFLNSYSRIAEIDDLNLVIHVGDFIYPELDRYTCARVPSGLDPTCRDECIGKELPVSENANITSLIAQHDCKASVVDRFRWVYQYYLHDPQLRVLRRTHPFIVIFDNHDLGSSRSVNLTAEGSLQAFVEYVPVRARPGVTDNSTTEFFKSYRFGNMFNLIALDTRAVGIKVEGDGTYLGLSQIAWVTDVLQQSQTVNWRVVMTTTAFAPWAVNGWDMYVNGVFAGVFVALLVLTGTCLGGTYFFSKRAKRTREDSSSKDENQVLLHPTGTWKKKALFCCSGYGVFSVLLLVVIWIAATVVAKQIIASRQPSSTSGNLELIAAQDRSWDGHPKDRRDFLQIMRATNTSTNNVWISGDLHMSLAADVRDIDHNDASSVHTAERFGVEMLSSSVSRANVDEIAGKYIPGGFVSPLASLAHRLLTMANPHFRYFDVTEHGYGVLTFSKEKVKAEYWHTPILEPTSEQWLAKELVCLRNSNAWTASAA